VPAHRSNPDPPIHGQSTLGEWNRELGSFVGWLQAHIAGREIPSAAGGITVRVLGIRDLAVRVEGTVVKVQKFQGASREMDLTPFVCFICDL
jgi:hypothetical protein